MATRSITGHRYAGESFARLNIVEGFVGPMSNAKSISVEVFDQLSDAYEGILMWDHVNPTAPPFSQLFAA